MQARELAKTAQVTLNDGRTATIPLVWRKGGLKVLVYVVYGQIVATVGTKYPPEYIQPTLLTLINRLQTPKASELSFKSMLDWPHRTVYILGKKRLITTQEAKKSDEAYFYHPANADFTRAFDQAFATYLYDRIKKLAEQAGIGPRAFTVRVGHYRSKQASFRPADALFEFDRRMFAYNSIVIDSVICHELAHAVSLRHDRVFYETLYCQMPALLYKRCKRIITVGRFADDPRQIP